MKISILIPPKNRLPILRETLHNIYFVNKLPKEDRIKIIEKISSTKSEDKQVNLILKYIDQLGDDND